MRAVVYFKYSIYCPEEVMKSALSSVCLLLWSEQTISHLRISLVILCCFIRSENIYPRYLEKLRKSIKNVTVNCLFVTVRANLLSWQWLESFSKVISTLCPTKRMTGRFLGYVFNGIDSFLNAFAKLRKATSFVMSVRPSIHMEQVSSHWRDFHSIWVFLENLSRKSKFH